MDCTNGRYGTVAIIKVGLTGRVDSGEEIKESGGKVGEASRGNKEG
jgi:hypothetical protein